MGENLWKSNSGGGGFKIEWYYVVSATESKILDLIELILIQELNGIVVELKIHFCGFID